MKLTRFLLTMVAGSLLLVSCNNDDDNNNSTTPQGAYDNGVLILNQGAFMQGNASVSFLSDAGHMDNNIFATNNANAVLGDTGQDIGLNGDYAYIVLNYSNKIEVVNRYTFVHVATISTGLNNPRYIAFEGGKGYVTNWGDGNSATDDYIAVINLNTNAVTVNIPVAEGPEEILENNGKLYVSHYGGYNFGHSVTVIDGASDTVQTTIATGDAPKSMFVYNGSLYVLSEGIPSWGGVESAGKLQTIDLSSNTVSSSVDFPLGQHPTNLVYNSGGLYYVIGNNVYTRAIGGTALPVAPLFTLSPDSGINGFYSFAVHGDTIYLGDGGDFASAGEVYTYSLAGVAGPHYTVGVAPAGFYFNE